MLLAIDTGNTNTVFAVFDDAGGMIGEWRSSTNVDRTADEIGVWLSQLFALQNISRQDITSGIIATVVPATLFSLRKMFRRYFHCQALVVGAPDVDIGIGVLVDRPDEVGADRLVNAVATYREYGGPKIIVDRQGWQLPRRRHRPRRQSVAGGAAPGFRPVAAGRDRPA